MLIEIQPPNWTDILQGIGSIAAVPAAVAAFVILFLKDQHKQKQIDSLIDISKKIEAQNEIMNEANILADEQVNVLRQMLLSPSNSDSGYDKLAEIEGKKLKLSVQPNLKSSSQSYRMEELWVDINNYGESAFIDEIVFEGDIFYQLSNIKSGYEIVKDSKIRVGGRTKMNENTNYIDYSIRIKFHDKLMNNYLLHINRIVASKTFDCKQIEIE